MKLIKHLVAMPTDISIKYQYLSFYKKLNQMKHISALMFYTKYIANKMYCKYIKDTKKVQVNRPIIKHIIEHTMFTALNIKL